MNQNHSPLLRRVLTELDLRRWRADPRPQRLARVVMTFQRTKPLWISPFARPAPQPANDLD